MDASKFAHLGDALVQLDALIRGYMERKFNYNYFSVEVVARDRDTGDFASYAFNIALMSPEVFTLWQRFVKLAAASPEMGKKLDDFLTENS